MVIALLVAVAIGLAYDKRVAAVFVVSSVAVFALLRGVAAGLMALARRMPRSRITMLRLAIANIYRPGALTPSVVMSLGLGLAVLVTITQIDGNLRRQFLAALPEQRAVVLLHRHSDRRCRPLRRLPQAGRAAIDGRGRADAARAHRRRPRRQGRRAQAVDRIPNGCCRATAA